MYSQDYLKNQHKSWKCFFGFGPVFLTSVHSRAAGVDNGTFRFELHIFKLLVGLE